MWIDAVAYSVHVKNNIKVNPAYWIPGFAATFYVLMLMPLSSSAVNETIDFSGGSRASRARIWFLLAFIIGIGSVIAGLALMLTEYLQRHDERVARTTWPGIALCLQTVFIFLSGLVYRFGGDAVVQPYAEIY